MPFADLDGFRIHYALSGPGDLPVLVLSNSLGTDYRMWDPQLSEFEKRFRLLRYDTRGHGQSAVTAGPYSIEQLALDVLALLDHLEIPSVSFCGLSMGGMTGMWLGRNRPGRIRRLVLSNTAARIGTPESWNARITTVEQKGMRAIVPAVMERWFTPGFRAAQPEKTALAQQMLESASPEGYAASCAAVRDCDQRETIGGIEARTLVVAGAKDPVTTPDDARFLLSRIPGAEYLELEAAHISNIEAAERFNSGVERFLVD